MVISLIIAKLRYVSSRYFEYIFRPGMARFNESKRSRRIWYFFAAESRSLDLAEILRLALFKVQ